jgi:histidine triad (HIT) family protein
MSCVFCSLLLDAASADWVAKEEHAAAFLPLPTSSLAPGHTLVIPTAHASGVHEADASSLTATMALIQKVSLAMRATLGAPGVNLLSASGPGSEQSVPHLHFHVVPRWEDDGFTTWPSQRSLKKISESPARLLADAIREFDAGELSGPRD